MKWLDYINPVIWLVWMIKKVFSLGQKIPVEMYYGFGVLLTLALMAIGIITLYTPF